MTRSPTPSACAACVDYEVLLGRGDGSAEALRSFVPERIPDPLHIWASAGGSLGALASGQKNAVLRRGPSLLHPLLLGLSQATKELRLVYHLDPQLLRLLQFAPGILSRDQRSGLLADAAGHPAAGLLDQ